MKGPRSFSLSSYSSPFIITIWPLCCTRFVRPCLSSTGELRTGPSSPYGSHQCWLVGKLISLVLLAALLQPKDAICFLCGKRTWVHIQLGAHQDPRSFLAKLYSSFLAPSLYFPRFGTLNLLNFMRFLEPFLQLPFSRSGWQHSALVCQQFSIDPRLTLGL